MRQLDMLLDAPERTRYDTLPLIGVFAPLECPQRLETYWDVGCALGGNDVNGPLFTWEIAGDRYTLQTAAGDVTLKGSAAFDRWERAMMDAARSARSASELQEAGWRLASDAD